MPCKFTIFATLVVAAASGIAMAAPLYQSQAGTIQLSERGLADFQATPHFDAIVHLEARDPKKKKGGNKGGKGNKGNNNNKTTKSKTTKTKKSKTSKTKKSKPTPTGGADDADAV